jgi:hypothetical protein
LAAEMDAYSCQVLINSLTGSEIPSLRLRN